MADTHKVKISILKTRSCGKIIKLKSPSKYPPMLQLKTHQQSNHVITTTIVDSQSVVAYYFYINNKIYKIVSIIYL